MPDPLPKTALPASVPPSGAVALRRLAFGSVLLCLTVIILGAWVRLTDAGLGCPDWPGCYGHVTPAGAEKNDGKIESFSPGWDYDSGKAWREMIHRYAATALGLLIVLITAIAIAYRREKPMSVVYAVVLLATVVFQGTLGAFTVWWLVKPLVVVLHLAGGLTTLSLLFWLWLSMRRTTRVVQPVPGATRIAALDRARTAAIAATLMMLAMSANPISVKICPANAPAATPTNSEGENTPPKRPPPRHTAVIKILAINTVISSEIIKLPAIISLMLPIPRPKI